MSIPIPEHLQEEVSRMLRSDEPIVVWGPKMYLVMEEPNLMTCMTEEQFHNRLVPVSFKDAAGNVLYQTKLPVKYFE